MAKKQEVSRQRQWQIKVRQEGRCTQCGDKPEDGLATMNHCAECADAQNERGKARYRQNNTLTRVLCCSCCGEAGHNRKTCAQAA